MCGIVGYIGKKEKTLEVVLHGLSSLEYRGYDSAGVAYKVGDSVNIVKAVGRISNLKEKMDLKKETVLGIGHTRWATHGEANLKNSHPHRVGKITLVHNGIVENYAELKSELSKRGVKFNSDTDTEVACALINELYKANNSIMKSIELALTKITGSYAFAIMVDGMDELYVAKNKSPLIIGIGNNENYIASDVPAILEYTNKYIHLDDLEYGVITKDSVQIYDISGNKVKKQIKTFEGDSLSAGKAGYDYFMEKEMNEQPTVFKNNIKEYLNEKFNELPSLDKYNRIDIVACGSAYHAGLVGKFLIEKYAKKEVNVDIASEYRYKELFIDNKTLVIVISQSGETADTLAALEIAKERGSATLAIVNVKDSTIARAADKVLYTNAGPEIAVATTKGYFSQVTLLALLALKSSKLNVEEIKKEAAKVPVLMEELLNRDYTELAKKIYKKEDIYFLGRKIDYAIALEGSLKLKEISYIHSEAYAAGELKHGTISLITDNTPVISILTEEDIISKTISNIKETKARGAYTVTIKKEGIESYDDYSIIIPKTHELLQTLLAIIPLQMLSFEIAKLRNCDIDKPRNLAKSVTVE